MGFPRVIGRGRRREHLKDTSEGGHVTFGHYGCCATSGCAYPREPRRASSDLWSHPVAMLLLLRKTRGKKRGMRRTYFRSGPLLDRATSWRGQVTFGSHVTTTKKKAREKAGHAQNLLPVRTTSGQGLFQSWLTSLPVKRPRDFR